MMKTMRAIAPWIMFIVAVTFVGWMVFEWGMDIQGQGQGGPSQAIATVNGVKIDPILFDQRVRLEQEAQRQQGLPAATTTEEWRELQDQVLEQMIIEVLLAQEYRRRDITVSDDEVREAVLNIPLPEFVDAPDFQTEGQFDMEKYRRYIQSMAGELTIPLENRYREQLRQYKLQAQLSEDVHPTDAELWRSYRDRNDSVTANVLAIVPSVVAREQTLEISDADLDRYYREHPDEFRRPAQAYLSFVAISRRANAEDSAAAYRRAQDLREEIVAGADFAEVASRESADSTSRVDGGDLGDRSFGQFVPPFEEAVRALRPGQMSFPILTNFGYHLIRLESRRDTIYHVRHILVPIEAVGEHLNEIDRRADSLDLFAAELDDPTVLDTIAADLELPVAQAPPLTEGNRLQLGRFLVPDVHIWAFESLVGQTSAVIETDWAYYVFRLDSLMAERVPPLADIRDQVRRLALQDVQWERARALAQEVRASVASGTELEQIASDLGLTVQRVGPFTRVSPAPTLRDAPEAVGAAFGLPMMAVGGPYESQFAIFFLEPVRIVFADSSAFEAQMPTDFAQTIQQARSQRVQSILSSMRAQANVVDHRLELERARREAAAR